MIELGKMGECVLKSHKTCSVDENETQRCQCCIKYVMY